MPKKTELTERGIGGLWAAMGRRGGVDSWREVVTAHLAGAPVAEPLVEPVAAPIAEALVPVEEQIAVAAYFLFQNGHPGGPETHWQVAERQLAVA